MIHYGISMGIIIKTWICTILYTEESEPIKVESVNYTFYYFRNLANPFLELFTDIKDPVQFK